LISEAKTEEAEKVKAARAAPKRVLKEGITVKECGWLKECGCKNRLVDLEEVGLVLIG